MWLDGLRLNESSCAPVGQGPQGPDPNAFIEGLFWEVEFIQQDWGPEGASGPKLLQTHL